ncbi:hypothetical protein NDU88_000494 [Pleurodeles waltl]|uniref:Uncharacterized protein n=1 Tax=Pleurodeles waltl TaxID=8319 RepID=A0AAV7UQ48_PLEWA|nr:hypothetical protein NDU88_000494 [Pleurodeles waltl]
MPMPVAWALQGPPGAPRPPLPPSGSRRSDRRDLDGGRGGRNPRGGAASCAAAEDSMGPRYTGGTPPVVPVRPRLYRRGRNPHWSTAGLSAVLPRSSALAVKDRQGQNDHLILLEGHEQAKFRFMMVTETYKVVPPDSPMKVRHVLPAPIGTKAHHIAQ